jgi:microcystin-dependent protein
MATPFLAQVQMFAFNFAPKGWAFCSGQLMPISQNTALFSLLGTTYGGDGKSTFALPKMIDNAAISAGQGPGLSLYDLGEQTGTQTVTLLQTELPSHNHGFIAQTVQGTSPTANANQLAKAFTGAKTAGFVGNYLTTNAVNTPMPQATSIAGSSFPHNNMQPYLTLNFCIALQGIFPARP